MNVLLTSYMKLFLLIVYFVFHSNAYTDDEFCHPHCLITCLPSCQCCDSNNPRKADIAESSKRNQLKLERLEQVLRDKDLEVGIICRPSCKERCLPSCKFECCRDNRSSKKQGLKTATDLKIKAGFDLRKLLKSMEETQNEYKRLKEFIKKVNTSSTDSLHGGGFHIVTKPKVHHKRRKVAVKHTDKDQNMKLLKTLSKLQDVINEREEIKKKEKQRILDSPYGKLLTSKPKLKVEIFDESEKADIDKAIPLKNLQNTKQSKQTSGRKKLKHFQKQNVEKSNCGRGCKRFCSPSCKFECCVTKDSQPMNSTKNKDFKNETNEISNLTSNGSPSNQSEPIAVETETLLHTKKQIDGLIGELERVSSFHGQNKSANSEVCNATCKTDCIPECPFQCCV